MATILRRGDKGAHVERIQAHLRGAGFDPGGVDGDFGPKTEAAVREYQRARDLVIDGAVGPQTLEALLSETQRIPTVTPTPPKPAADLVRLTPFDTSQMRRVCGRFDYTVNRDGTVNRDAAWERENLETVFVPQLRGVPLYDVRGTPFGGKVRVHKAFSGPLLNAFEAIEALGLLKLVLTWDGADCARLVRGGSSLSNHAFGAAFDINAGWNGLGRRPAERGQEGSVLELVPIFAAYGIGWGGWWARPDGMHFGLGKVV